MLIITRRVGETINIGDDTEVSVLGVKGNQVRIGVNAPQEIAVHREEIYQRIQAEKSLNLEQVNIFSHQFRTTDGREVFTEVAAESRFAAEQFLMGLYSINQGTLVSELICSADKFTTAPEELSHDEQNAITAFRKTLKQGCRPPCTITGSTEVARAAA